MQHSELASGRWFTMTIAEQLGNVGSEYDRALNWQNKDDERFNSARNRFLELLDLTINDPRWSGSRKKELQRVRDEADKEFLEGSGKTEDLKKYFLQFAILARANQKSKS